MGSYGDESYTPKRSSGPEWGTSSGSSSSGSSSGPFFRPKPSLPPSPPPSKVKPASAPKTGKAANVKPPVDITRPAGKVNLILAFDTTGSMGAHRDNVRAKAAYLYEEINNFLPDLLGDMQISFVGIGDHEDKPAMLQATNFSSDVQALRDNVGSIKDTHGADEPEAFECLFKELNGWDLGDKKNTVLILVTDSVPHGMGYPYDDGCPLGINWRTELDVLKQKLLAFYVVTPSTSARMKEMQRNMVGDDKHLLELPDSRRLTNVVHAVIAVEVGKLDEYLKHLGQTRGDARVTEVKTILKTNPNTKS